MTTIHVVIAEKQYSSSKVLAAFDTEEAANKLRETIEAVEPRWVIEVKPVELQRAPTEIRPASFVTSWHGAGPERPPYVETKTEKPYEPGGPTNGTITVRDGEPEVFIPSTSAAADKL